MRRTSRWARIPLSDDAISGASMSRSNRRVMVPGASLVCSVLNSRCPVCEASSAIFAVSWSRISPTSTTLGSWRRNDRSPEAKVRPARGLIWTWLIPGRRNSIGSSIVTMFLVDDLTQFSAA